MTLINEAVLAGHGVFSLALGKKDAERFFTLTLFGLTGAAIALIIAMAISAFTPVILGNANEMIPPNKAFIYTAGVYLVQIGAGAIVLNQLKRLDAFIPYLVADFWSTFYVTLVTLVISMFNLEKGIFMLVLAILVLAIKINIIRLIVKLPFGQITLFFAAHLIAGFIALIVLGSILGIEPIQMNELQ